MLEIVIFSLPFRIRYKILPKYLDLNGNPVSTNWYDVVYRQGVSQNHSMSISGANDKTTYYNLS